MEDTPSNRLSSASSSSNNSNHDNKSSDMPPDVAPKSSPNKVVPDDGATTTPTSIAIVCEEDGQTWAEFIKSKLGDRSYSLSTWVQPLATCDPISVAERSKIQMLLLSPTFLDSVAAERLLSFSINTCILILLGVDEDDVRKTYGGDSADILKFRRHVIDEANTGKSLKDALVKIIQFYEDDKSDDGDDDDAPIYEYLPMGKPVQVNKVIKVFPSDSLVSGSELYLLLDHKADEAVNIIIEKPGVKTIPAKHLDHAVYKFTIPEETSGSVHFRVESENKNIGKHSATTSTKLEQLRSLLEDSTSPLTLMCQALGIPADTATLDKKLADQVKDNLPKNAMPFMMQVFESQEHGEETSSEVWPTVLHFAAEYNLEHFATELLKYPGMVNAAMTANVREKYPCEIAREKGFASLGEMLYSYVAKYGKHPDSGVVVDAAPPTPCSGPRGGYVNVPPGDDSEDSYLNMENPEIAVKPSTRKVVEHAQKPVPKPRSKTLSLAEIGRFHAESSSSSITFDNDNSDSSDDCVPPDGLSPLRSGHRDPCSEKPESLSEVLSKIQKPTKAQSMSERHRGVGLGLASHAPPRAGACTMPPSPTKPRSFSLGTERTMAPLQNIQQEIRCSGAYERIPDDEKDDAVFTGQISPSMPGEGKKTGRISKFLNKFRRQSNESDQSKKTKVTSTTRLFQNLNKSVSAGRKYSHTAAELERDSGSYSDEDDEKEAGSPRSCKKQFGKGKGFLERKKSIRVIRALEEKVENAPNLPLRSGKREFVKDFS